MLRRSVAARTLISSIGAVPAHSQTAKIVSLGASTRIRFNQETGESPAIQRDYFALAQGFMSGALIRAPKGVDEASTSPRLPYRCKRRLASFKLSARRTRSRSRTTWMRTGPYTTVCENPEPDPDHPLAGLVASISTGPDQRERSVPALSMALSVWTASTMAAFVMLPMTFAAVAMATITVLLDHTTLAVPMPVPSYLDSRHYSWSDIDVLSGNRCRRQREARRCHQKQRNGSHLDLLILGAKPPDEAPQIPAPLNWD